MISIFFSQLLLINALLEEIELHLRRCGALPGCKVDVDVDEHHDAGRQVERAEGGVEDVARLLAQLKGSQIVM